MKNQNIIHKDLSYEIIGIAYEAHNELGYGFQEKYYCRAIEALLQEHSLKFREQVYIPIVFKGKKIGSYYLDFLIEDKVILEVKKGDQFYKKDIEQVYAYLKSHNLQLGVIVRFAKNGVKVKRIVNLR